MSTKADPADHLTAILQDDDLVDGALQQAALQAIREHKEEGLPLAMWRDGQVVWMSAEEVEAEIGDGAS